MDASTLLSMVPTQYVAYVSAGVTIAAALSTILPVPKPATNKVYTRVYGWLQYVAFNFGNAVNAEPKVTSSTTTETK